LKGLLKPAKFLTFLSQEAMSVYNDTEGTSIYPTPVLGVVGVIKDLNTVTTPEFKQSEDTIILLGINKEELGASEYLRQIHNKKNGPSPEIDLKAEKKVQEFCLEAISKGMLNSAHDLSQGGLAQCLAECCFLGKKTLGCQINLDDMIRTDSLLFGETQSRILTSLELNNVDSFIDLAQKRRIPFSIIGKTGGKNICIKHRGKTVIDIPVQKVYYSWKNSIPDYFRKKN
jgi:phosphoribosylformylglycinamidine synthase